MKTLRHRHSASLRREGAAAGPPQGRRQVCSVRCRHLVAYLPPFGMIRHFPQPPLLVGLLSGGEFKYTSPPSTISRSLGLPLRWSHAGAACWGLGDWV